MQNPFLQNGFVMPTASVNTVRIMGLGGLPIDPSIKNSTAKELLCRETVEFLMNRFYSKNGIDNQTPFEMLENIAENGSGEIQRQAENVLKKLGYNLGYILLVLKRGDSENKAARSNWSEDHWDYWKSLKKIEIAGGLAQGRFGKKMLEHTKGLFNELNIIPYDTYISRDAGILPLIGAARFAAQRCDSVAFDFGHSYIKSCVIKKGTTNTLYIQDKIAAQHVIGDNDDEQFCMDDALALDKFIREVILSVLERAKRYIDITKTTDIAVSIANYISGGRIAQRGSYRKLSLIAENYGQHLSKKLSETAKMPLNVTLIHDSTSAAIAAKKPQEDSAVITLGTSIGVGFTDCVCEMPEFLYVLG